MAKSSTCSDALAVSVAQSGENDAALEAVCELQGKIDANQLPHCCLSRVLQKGPAQLVEAVRSRVLADATSDRASPLHEHFPRLLLALTAVTPPQRTPAMADALLAFGRSRRYPALPRWEALLRCASDYPESTSDVITELLGLVTPELFCGQFATGEEQLPVAAAIKVICTAYDKKAPSTNDVVDAWLLARMDDPNLRIHRIFELRGALPQGEVATKFEMHQRAGGLLPLPIVDEPNPNAYDYVNDSEGLAALKLRVYDSTASLHRRLRALSVAVNKKGGASEMLQPALAILNNPDLSNWYSPNQSADMLQPIVRTLFLCACDGIEVAKAALTAFISDARWSLGIRTWPLTREELPFAEDELLALALNEELPTLVRATAFKRLGATLIGKTDWCSAEMRPLLSVLQPADPRRIRWSAEQLSVACLLPHAVWQDAAWQQAILRLTGGYARTLAEAWTPETEGAGFRPAPICTATVSFEGNLLQNLLFAQSGLDNLRIWLNSLRKQSAAVPGEVTAAWALQTLVLMATDHGYEDCQSARDCLRDTPEEETEVVEFGQRVAMMAVTLAHAPRISMAMTDLTGLLTDPTCCGQALAFQMLTDDLLRHPEVRSALLVASTHTTLNGEQTAQLSQLLARAGCSWEEIREMFAQSPAVS